MAKTRTPTLASWDLLGRVGTQKTTREYLNKEEIYSQGDAANAMFYVESGHVKLTVASNGAKRLCSRFWEKVTSLARTAFSDTHGERRPPPHSISPRSIA